MGVVMMRKQLVFWGIEKENEGRKRFEK